MHPHMHTAGRGGGGGALPVDRDAEDAPQAGEDFVNNLRVSVGAKFGGDNGLLDVCRRQKHAEQN